MSVSWQNVRCELQLLRHDAAKEQKPARKETATKTDGATFSRFSVSDMGGEEPAQESGEGFLMVTRCSIPPTRSVKRARPAYLSSQAFCSAWGKSSKLDPPVCLTQVGQQGAHSGTGMPGAGPVRSSRAFSNREGMVWLFRHPQTTAEGGGVGVEWDGGACVGGVPPPQSVHVHILPAVTYFIFSSIPAPLKCTPVAPATPTGAPNYRLFGRRGLPFYLLQLFRQSRMECLWEF